MAEVETVYGTHEDSRVMSEKVQALAANVYSEFERMIKKYDEDVVKDLMPILVGILETLDQAQTEKQESEVELELLRDDNEQLLTQYEREKQLRKTSEQKYLEVEDSVEEERKQLQDKVESLENILRMFELKVKNATDQVSRLEERENEKKKEYTILHDRYTELFRTHMEYMERTKMMMAGQERLADLTPSPRGKGGFMLPNLRAVPGSVNIYANAETPQAVTPTGEFSSTGSHRSPGANTSLKHELDDSEKGAEKGAKVDKQQNTDSLEKAETSTSTASLQSPTQSSRSSESNTESSAEHENTSEKSKKESSVTKVAESSTVEGSEVEKPSVINNNKQLIHAQHFLDSIEESYEFDSFHHTSTGIEQTMAEIMASTPELGETEDMDGQHSTPLPKRQSSAKNESSLFEELTFQDSDVIGEMDDGVDLTGKLVDPGEYATSDSENEDHESHVSDNFFGMGKEVENLISENNELLATKNALNIVKDDLIAKVDELSSELEMLRGEINSLQAVKTRLQLRITELEDELKKTKDELDKKSSAPADDEDDVPMAQRKRFTRVEMARVLMERNQYKERLMELQEAVRWTEMIRASREHPDITTNPKKKSSVWGFFGNLFSSSSTKPSKKTLPSATVRYNAPTTNVQPVGDPNRPRRNTYNLGEKAKAYEFLQDDALNQKSRKEREKERREQYKQVRAHVKKDNGRLQAYGWSLPAKFQSSSPRESGKNNVPVPVPVYCRPLLEKEPGMKLWCAAGVSLSGGRTRDGGSRVGASVFYSSLPDEEHKTKAETEIEKLDQELKDHEKGIKDLEKDVMSSLVWICTTMHASSKVTVIDANNPGDILETFHVTSSHILCISSVPGAKETDYPVDESQLKADIDLSQGQTQAPSSREGTPAENSGIGGVTLVQCATGAANQSGSGTPEGSLQGSRAMTPEDQTELTSVTNAITDLVNSMDWKDDSDQESDEKGDPLGATTTDNIKATVIKTTGSPASSGSGTPTSSGEKRFLKEPTELIKDGLSSSQSDASIVSEEVEKASSILPTMWLGSQSGSLYVHSAVSSWKKCLHSVKLRDSVLSIVHVKGRVLVALADGTVAMFHRDKEGQWDLANYYLLDLGRPHHSIRCMVVVGNKHVWCGYRNKVYVVDPQTLKIDKCFDAHPRKESQVRQMSWVGDGVWISIRLDSTLRLYHAYTHDHLQDVDIEPYVSKMLGTGKLGFSFIRITSLLISNNRLWIGTGNGVVISVPLSESSRQQITSGHAGKGPGGVVRVYSDNKGKNVTPGSYIPYCTMAQAQLSFHGHRDAVKFFVAVPGSGAKNYSSGATTGGYTTASVEKSDPNKPNPDRKATLILSGGEGYIDFRIGDGDDEDAGDADGEEQKQTSLSRGDRSHLIVWEVSNST